MATDEDYMAFLNKANEDPFLGSNEARPVTSSSNPGKVEYKSIDHPDDVPEVLRVPTQKEEWIYISDADEPFVPVSLKTTTKDSPTGKLLDEESFANLIHHPSSKEADITIMDVSDWDPKGAYKDVVDAVRAACKGADVRVYKVPKGGVRVEYWVVGVVEGKLVGVKALAVES